MVISQKHVLCHLNFKMAITEGEDSCYQRGNQAYWWVVSEKFCWQRFFPIKIKFSDLLLLFSNGNGKMLILQRPVSPPFTWDWNLCQKFQLKWKVANSFSLAFINLQDLDNGFLHKTELETKLSGLHAWVELMSVIHEQVRKKEWKRNIVWILMLLVLLDASNISLKNRWNWPTLGN